MCGGNRAEGVAGRGDCGLSPRVRGKLWSILRNPIIAGSIPACAGETDCLPDAAAVSGVYPRVCGGNGAITGRQRGRQGLSPRVRGKLLHRSAQVVVIWSIPACAGETRVDNAQGNLQSVYPRVCGGNRRSAATRNSRVGLSPRVRGKHYHTPAKKIKQGSIPACAGETYYQDHQSP